MAETEGGSENVPLEPADVPESPRENDVRLDGYVVLITGASAGIGKETARALALKGAKVVMGNRDLEKTDRVLKAMREEAGEDALPEDRFDVKKMDLTDFDSVRTFCETVKKDYPVIDIMINNAGYANYQDPRKETDDGHEVHMQTNHLGGFLLTHLLIDNLLASKRNPRLIFVSSCAYKFYKAGIDFDDLEFEDPDKYSGYEAYCLSKLANLLTARKLARKYKGKINTYAVHPGNVKTEIGRNELSLGYRIVETVFFKPFQLTERRGSFSTVHCAASQDVSWETGLFYDCNGKPQEVDANIINEENEDKMWDKTCDLLNITWE